MKQKLFELMKAHIEGRHSTEYIENLEKQLSHFESDIAYPLLSRGAYNDNEYLTQFTKSVLACLLDHYEFKLLTSALTDCLYNKDFNPIPCLRDIRRKSDRVERRIVFNNPEAQNKRQVWNIVLVTKYDKHTNKGKRHTPNNYNSIKDKVAHYFYFDNHLHANRTRQRAEKLAIEHGVGILRNGRKIYFYVNFDTYIGTAVDGGRRIPTTLLQVEVQRVKESRGVAYRMHGFPILDSELNSDISNSEIKNRIIQNPVTWSTQ